MDDVIIINEGDSFDFFNDIPTIPTKSCWPNGFGCRHFECIGCELLWGDK